MTGTRPTSPAFTLIELLLVLVVVSTALAIAAPSLSGWGRGARLRDAGDAFLATAKWARMRAIASGQIHRLNVDPDNGRYWVTTQEGVEFVAATDDFGREQYVSDDAVLEMTDGEAQPLDAVTFYPTGRVSPPANVRLADDRGAIDIVCETPAEGFRLLKPGERVQQ